jgi:hypothetical protein
MESCASILSVSKFSRQQGSRLMVAVTDRQTEDRDSERLGKTFTEPVFTERKE